MAILYTFTYFLFMVIGAWAQTVPNWITSPYVRAGSRNVINTLTGSSTAPIATLTFSSAFTVIPNLAYGVHKYEGSDVMISQMWEVNKTSLTISSFTVKIQISGYTNIWVMAVRYFAIDKSFPHKLNSYDNVPVNYGSTLSNITVKSPTLVTYTNVINFTTQSTAAGYTFKTFLTPLSGNKIITFMTTLLFSGTDDANLPANPLLLTTTTTVLSSTTYEIKVTSGVKSKITGLRYSMIIFDQAEVERSGIYFLAYERIYFSKLGGFIPFPSQFIDSMIIGLIEFQSPYTRSTIHFIVDFITNSNGVFGINMAPSVPRDPIRIPFLSFNFSLFYLKTWTCQTNSFLNLADSLCYSCSIPNCTVCLSLTICDTCDTANGYILHPLSQPDLQCTLCEDPNCLSCPTATVCTVCDEGKNYFLSANSSCEACSIPFCLNCSSLTSCIQCDEASGYFIDSNYTNTNTSDICIQCSIPYCTSCDNLTVCLACNSTLGYSLNPNATSNLDQCIICNVSNCLQCLSSNVCISCDVALEYYLNTTSDQCELCSIPNCIMCDNLTSCAQCNITAGFFFNSLSTSINDICIACSIAGCLDCIDLTSCNTCDNSNNYFLNYYDQLCYQCLLFKCLSCTQLTMCAACEAPYVLNTNNYQCQLPVPICGDNIFLSNQRCDDGNLINGDGCSSTCQVQPDYLCQLNTLPNLSNSVCYYTGEITFQTLYIEKMDNTNQILIVVQIGPKQLSFWDSVDFPSMVILSNTTLFNDYQVIRNNDGTVSIYANYNMDIHDINITVEMNPSLSGSPVLSRANTLYKSFSVVPKDNEAALYYNDDTYKMANVISLLSVIIGAAYILFFIIGMFSLKLIGIEMMGVIQISYLSLMCLTQMNPCFKALTNIWFVNGFSYFNMDKTIIYGQTLPGQILSLHLYPLFFQNYNLTAVLIFLPLIISLILLVLSIVFKNNLDRRQKLQFYAKKSACEYSFNGLMFSGYIIAVSLALQFKYGIIKIQNSLQIISITQAAAIIVLLILYFGLIIKFSKYFGEFVLYFKKKSKEQSYQTSELTEEDNDNEKCQINSKWYNMLMLERLIVGGCLVFMLQMKLSPIFTICIFLIISILALIRRPYKQLRHTLRFVCNLLTCMIIQGIYLTYKMTSLQSQQKKSIWFYLPIFVCVLLIICLIYNIIFMILQCWIKQRDKKQQIVNNQEQKLDKTINKTVMTETDQLINSPQKQTKYIQKIQEIQNIQYLQISKKQILRQIKQSKEFKADKEIKNKQEIQNPLQYDMI